MRKANPGLEKFLHGLAVDARSGDRLPTVRELMRRFGVSQMVVQRALQGLRERGIITSQVGRGTYFLADGSSASGQAARDESRALSPGSAGVRSPLPRSVLLLRRSISIMRGRVLVEGLQRRFTADGHRVVELSYSDPDHALAVLKGLPRFDAGVIQSTFKTITVELLAALREKCGALAVDGAALIGTDVDAVGAEWGEPLAMAIAHLQRHGHRRIAYATTSHLFLATQMGTRRFEHLQRTLAGTELRSIVVPHLPDDNYETSLVGMMKADLDDAGRLPYTALVAWGIEDGAKFRSLLSDIGAQVPSTLSVVLLGRTDLANEHDDFFDTIGYTVRSQIDSLYDVIKLRWSDPSAPYGLRMIPVARRAGESTATPSQPDQGQDQAGHRRGKVRPAPAGTAPTR